MIATASETAPGRWAIATALLVALLLSALILWPRGSQPHPDGADARTVVLHPVSPAGNVARRLFADPIVVESAAPKTDAPTLIGIAGRLPNDAIAMVRDGEGKTRVVMIGQSYGGWRLESLSADAALFTRGSQRRRVALPSASEEAAAEVAE